jgi:pimeloyl-ACP methyl ester carboxylesterase
MLNPDPSANRISPYNFTRDGGSFNELTQTLIDAGFRTIGVESRGIGASTGGEPNATTTLDDLASDVHAVLAHAQTGASEAVHVMGHAFGNRVSRTFAMHYPGRTPRWSKSQGRHTPCSRNGPIRSRRLAFSFLINFADAVNQRRDQQMTKPPLGDIHWPVTKLLSSLAR